MYRYDIELRSTWWLQRRAGLNLCKSRGNYVGFIFTRQFLEVFVIISPFVDGVSVINTFTK